MDYRIIKKPVISKGKKKFTVIITIFMNLGLERIFRRFVRNVKLRQRQTLLFLIYRRFMRKKK